MPAREPAPRTEISLNSKESGRGGQTRSLFFAVSNLDAGSPSPASKYIKKVLGAGARTGTKNRDKSK